MPPSVVERAQLDSSNPQSTRGRDAPLPTGYFEPGVIDADDHHQRMGHAGRRIGRDAPQDASILPRRHGWDGRVAMPVAEVDDSPTRARVGICNCRLVAVGVGAEAVSPVLCVRPGADHGGDNRLGRFVRPVAEQDPTRFGGAPMLRLRQQLGDRGGRDP